MAKLDDQIVKLANAYKITVDECPLKTWKRFPDDCFGFWTDCIEKLYQFLVDINKIHPRIKFTLENSSSFYCGLKDEHDCCCHKTKSIPFLDTKLYIEDNHRISTENPQIRDAQFSKLREFLLSRDYNSSIVDSAIVRAKAILIEVA